jgi:hypothetical protein
MEVNKIIPVTVGVIGLGLLITAIVKVSKTPVTYSNNGISSNTTATGEVFNALRIANNLETAMMPDGLFNYTDEAEILKQLSGLSRAQFEKVFVAFGKRRYNTYTGNNYGIYKYNLATWLKSELGQNSTYYKSLKSDFPKYL